MFDKFVQIARRGGVSTLLRGAFAAMVGFVPLTVVLSVASPSSAATDSVAFSGAAGSNGNYTTTVVYSATTSTYTATAYDPANSSATFTYATTSGSAGCQLASVNSGTVTYAQPGTCVITATTTGVDKDQGKGGGDGNATGTTGTLTLTVLPAPQTISFTSTAPATPLVGSTYTVTASASSGLPVQFTVDGSSTSGCTIDLNTEVVTLAPPVGTCVVDANQVGNTYYAPAPQAQQSVTAALATQTISFTSTAPATPLVGSTYTVTASASSGLPVQFTVDGSSTSGCTIDLNTEVVTLAPPVGTCVVDANQVGNTYYAPAPQAQQSVTAALATQTISVTSPNPASVEYGATSTYQIHAIDSDGLAIDFATSSATCAVDANGLISGFGVGNCVVVLSAPASSSVSAATPVTFTLSVQAPPPPPVVTPPVVTPPVVTPPVVTPPVVTPPVVTPPVVKPPPPVVIRVSPPKPVRRPVPKLPRPMNVVIKPFAEASHTLTKPLLAQVWRLALAIRRQRYTTVTLTGYTDNVFTPAMDALLIRERSLVVSRQLRIDLVRLKVRRVTITIAPGLTIQLVTLNTTPSSRALNRRVVATLTAR